MPRVTQQRSRAFEKGRVPRFAETVRRRPPRETPASRSITERYLSYVYVFAGVLFTLGSILFLPGMGAAAYRSGVYAYFVGGLLYLKVALFDLEEAYISGPRFFDVAMNLLYVIGTAAYLLATVFYLPLVEGAVGGVTSTVIGSAGFIIGSLFFTFAAFLNGAHSGDAFARVEEIVRLSQRHHSKSGGPNSLAALCADRLAEKVLVLATTNSVMLGSLLFLVGSVLYLPVIGCGEMTEVIGTVLYLIGSVFFTAAGVLPIVRAHYFPKKPKVVDVESGDNKTRESEIEDDPEDD
mmetsp:Transcript_12120/g.48780  ORF Transcript_12120/g.48780 Transcript_12120/m.48780 type:complete len:294 (+) Transcript_12120:60-941(+)|eukprot:CAMPEP_0185714488 /NCGR_PEP_ID=MMETSP1164-20130828/38904_1 /TAXON_ID=1104430 /ORGANISM="Chrysoreinhardia sp, Strain CCMP2950" /LENGTH=293 /DNA_ID=CAMNT_0028382067 /DNA_START=12 /DNA_END=893 /DNA_ORIENTATION=+